MLDDARTPHTLPGRHEVAAYSLADRYARTDGRVFLTGVQALTRILIDQARRDAAAGLRTGGFVSGYRGSPLGAFDMELDRASDQLAEHRIRFLPAVNEEMGATVLLGTQQAETHATAQVDGVFGMWYGKGPGVDRSGDALKHGNAYGSSPHGGVLVVAGDDHGCVSSSMPHQSDTAFMAWFMPVLSPSTLAEYLSFGAYGYALSRYSGTWVGFKAIAEMVEAAQSVDLPPERAFVLPPFDAPPGGLHYRWQDLPSPQIETRLADKLRAVEAFVNANPIDRAIYGVARRRLGIVTSGKAHQDLMEALRLLGIDEPACARLGIDIYKVGLVYPLARRDITAFCAGVEEILVVEEKRGLIETQLRDYLYDDPKRPMIAGKTDETGAPLIPWTGELSPTLLVNRIADRLDRMFPGEGFAARGAGLLRNAPPVIQIPGATRTPYFCSGCPHNTSTRVPEGSQAMSGIGCHFMASWMGRDTTSVIFMGAEGANWAGVAPFTGNGHTFQNLGEGTWHHSGSMAIRQAIAAGVNITYKVLYNDAVAMTGGQPVDGQISPQAIAHVSRAEGVSRIALVSDQPEKFAPNDLPSGATVHHRRDLDAVQRELRTVPGVSMLIYEQTCAAEKRRRRKRATMEDPNRVVVINELVCEGCGDCSVASNCLSVQPVETEFGRKRRINQSSCNKDFSCIDGFCPSFVTLEGATRRKGQAADFDLDALLVELEQPVASALNEPFDLLVTGVGGTGVITVGALVTMAAHLEGKGSSVLDFTGFAQKFGPVLSFVRIGRTPADINQVRIAEASADAVIACDAVVSASPRASVLYRPGTRIALNLASMPTGDLVLNRDAQLSIERRQSAIATAVGAENLAAFDAGEAAERLLGDAVFANVIMLGFAWQSGMVPVSEAALMRAIELNGVAKAQNIRAFGIGRVLAARPGALTPQPVQSDAVPETPTHVIERRSEFLEDYQSKAWARRYRDTLAILEARGAPEAHRIAAAKSLFKLMSYKDEYEVARLHRSPEFKARLARDFDGDFTLHYHLAPPALSKGKDARGRPLKRQFGPWTDPLFAVLKAVRSLRGTPLDPFGYTQDRRLERDLIAWFDAVIDRYPGAGADQDHWAQILAAPMEIRGYGPVKDAAAEKVKAEVEILMEAAK
ncbi:indolepyruvate ferredoxin oxidoreductase family protein [Seohaeicola zhoushanensis]|uniref:MFS transporter n=1 Tax=Seohaeicola zhoushanensis TaxID=1569283 RepID=A0A8J3H346_9RHOB|nr:indolepyruvate ferredoxin oxidoreductase family protein [Seohaeicola zhoushanensis]GHF72174.1 MFS transporter [Seohaeicola zhoushanensis]